MIHKSTFFCLCLWFNVTRGVFGVDADEVKSVSVMEGDAVTLHTDLTELQRRDQILWMFGHKSPDTLIAQIYEQKIKIDEIDDKSFKDKLQLDNQTGSLTITNIRPTDSGLYKLQIISKKISSKTFNVTVYARLPVPVIMRNSSQCSSSSERSSVSKCVLLCSVMNVTHVSLSWYKGNSLLSSISVSDLNIRLSLPLEVEYQDTNTYTCVINNTITNQTQHLHINDVCHKCSENQSIKIHWVAIVVVLVILSVGIISFGAVKYFKKNPSSPAIKEVQTHEEMLYTETTFCPRRIQSLFLFSRGLMKRTK